MRQLPIRSQLHRKTHPHLGRQAPKGAADPAVLHLRNRHRRKPPPESPSRLPAKKTLHPHASFREIQSPTRCFPCQHLETIGTPCTRQLRWTRPIRPQRWRRWEQTPCINSTTTEQKELCPLAFPISRPFRILSRHLNFVLGEQCAKSCLPFVNTLMHQDNIRKCAHSRATRPLFSGKFHRTAHVQSTVIAAAWTEVCHNGSSVDFVH